MIRFLVFVLFLKSIAFGCSLCSIYSPKTHISLDINTNKSYITDVQAKWVFDENFTNELFQLYDTNLDSTFDSKELLLIEDALLAYIETKNYLMFISYGKELSKYSLNAKVKNKKLVFKNNELSFEYNFELNLKMIYGHKLYIEIYDEASYFVMIFNKEKQLFRTSYINEKEIDTNSITYTLLDDSLRRVGFNKRESFKEKKKIEKVNKKETLIEKSIKEDEQNIKKEKTLDVYVQKIKQYLVKIEKEKDILSLVLLLLASFVYGIIHALGPGHGKALAFSYFASQKSSFLQALIISMASAFVHILGALILVIVSIFILQSVFSSFLDDSISYITKTSAILIMILSLYILYKKFKKKSCICISCTNTSTFSLSDNNYNPLKQHNNVKIENRKKQDLYFVLTAGLIPCPGTVILFVYAFILKTYLSVFLAALFISLGMGLVIFVSSFLGLSLNKVSLKSHRFKNILEIISPIVMFILGLLLFLNANLF